MTRYTGPRLPLGHPELNDHLFWIACCHEAGHAVAAYHLRFPSKKVLVNKPTHGFVEMAHVERDLEAIEIGRDYLEGMGENLAKLLLAECTVCEIGRAINIAVNRIPASEANGYASSDQEFLDEAYELSEFGDDVIAWAEKEKVIECIRLIRNRSFQIAVEAVADALVANEGKLNEQQVIAAIEGAVGTKLRNPSPEPPRENIELAAYYLRLKRGEASDPFHNWLSAEKGLRFGIACRIV